MSVDIGLFVLTEFSRLYDYLSMYVYTELKSRY